ncbi:unnamed protein product [Lasius platythorax]|uniref:Gag-pol polyprotein n=1 Tax=Lasius platythorax TaxID=488582 RepID=A0AAV2MXS8_9HYME
MTDAKTVATPAEYNTHLSTEMSNNTLEITVPYREAIGSLMFAACISRPDIMYAVSVVSRYLTKPGHEHWLAVKRILRYIKGTINYGIVYEGTVEDWRLIGFTDADYAGDQDTRKSTSGYIFTLCGGPVS